MKGSFGAKVCGPLTVAILTLSFLAASITSAGAASVTTTTTPSVQTLCGVVANPKVHFVSKQLPCVIRVHPGTNVRIRLRTGFRWGYPTSSSRAVIVTNISRDSVGVVAATLHASVSGRATIRTTGTVYCMPGVACPDLALLWSLEVIVT
jgi:hypothetical protein